MARRVADSSRGRLSRKESSSLRNAAVNAIWTKCRLKEAGYELETSLCDMCHQENDTLYHRIWFCKNPQAVAARNRFASAALQAEATKENADLLWVTRAITDDPSDHLPPLSAKDCAVKEEIWDPEAWESGTDSLCAFSDGSFTPELSREMKRASWGLIFCDSSNKAIARFFGALRSIAKPWPTFGTSFSRSSWRPVKSDPNRPNVKQVRWVKSHQDLNLATSAEERQDIQRNDEVDSLTKAALQWHDDDTWEWAKQRAQMKTTSMMAQTIGATLALWPRLGRIGLRPATTNVGPTPGPVETHREQPHVWVFERRGWRCTLCTRVAKVRNQPEGSAQIYKTLNTTTGSGSKRNDMATSSAERSMGPLLSSVVCAAEHMQDGACADWLRNVRAAAAC